jgi:hypothetical protein
VHGGGRGGGAGEDGKPGTQRSPFFPHSALEWSKRRAKVDWGARMRDRRKNARLENNEDLRARGTGGKVGGGDGR